MNLIQLYDLLTGNPPRDNELSNSTVFDVILWLRGDTEFYQRYQEMRRNLAGTAQNLSRFTTANDRMKQCSEMYSKFHPKFPIEFKASFSEMMTYRRLASLTILG